MHLQRILIVSLSFLGIIAVFLPWFSYNYLFIDYKINGIENLSVPGIERNGNGWFIIGLFALCIILAVLKDLNKSIQQGYTVGILLASILASVIIIINLLTLDNQTDNFIGNLFKTKVDIEYGIYLILICGIGIPIALFLLKDKEN